MPRLTRGRKLLLFGTLLLFVVVALGAPFTHADPFHESLRQSLERSLERRVTFKEVRYRLFPSPGLSARDLIIGDDAAFGLEPFAYVGSLEARISFWRSLRNGRIELSLLRLEDASVNFARQEGAGWNLTALLSQFARRADRDAPALQLRGGRINFRTGTLKSSFYLNAVDLDLTTNGEAFTWNYEAAPARTDRAEQGFGHLIGQGRWTPASGARGGVLEVDMELERSATTEVVTLLMGRDLGLQGRLASRARFAGPIDDIHVSGSVQFEGLERSGLFGGRGPALRFPYEGSLNLSEQRLKLGSAPPQKDSPALTFAVEVSRLLTDPRWTAELHFAGAAAKDFLDVSRRLGADPPDDLVVDGTLSGSLKLAQDQPPEGEIELQKATVKVGSGGELHLDQALLRLGGARLELLPATIATESGAEAELSGAWAIAGEALEFKLRGAKLAANDLKGALARIPRTTELAFFDPVEQGLFSGTLGFQRSESGVSAWSGEFELADSRVTLEGFAEPLRIEHVSVSLKGADFAVRRMTVHAGRQTWNGELAWRAGATRPARFKLSTKEITAETLERILAPSLARRTGFIARTLRLSAALPAWMKSRRAEGELKIGTIRFGSTPVDNVTAKVFWDGGVIECPDVDARWMEGRFAGRLQLRAGAIPAYWLLGRVDNALWKGTRFDADIDLRSSGLADGFHAEGELQARNLPLGDDSARTVAACYDLQADRAGFRARLRCLEAQISGETYSGTAQTGADGRWLGDLTGPRGTLRLNGTLVPLQFDLAAR